MEKYSNKKYKIISFYRHATKIPTPTKPGSHVTYDMKNTGK